MHHPALGAQGVAPHLPRPAQVPARVQEWQGQQAARRSVRAHNPIHSRQAAGRSQEGGKGHGRTRGSPNYRPREIKVLLDYVEAELPVGAKGWNAVGARFREWAGLVECPARTDRSLEMKFKQVGSSSPTHVFYSNVHFYSSYGPGSPLAMPNVCLKLNVLTLGANPYLPTGYMVSTWWVLKQNTQHGPTGSMLITF